MAFAFFSLCASSNTHAVHSSAPNAAAPSLKVSYDVSATSGRRAPGSGCANRAHASRLFGPCTRSTSSGPSSSSSPHSRISFSQFPITLVGHTTSAGGGGSPSAPLAAGDRNADVKKAIV